MSTVKDLHRRAMEVADLAFEYEKKGEKEAARQSFVEASDLESQAAELADRPDAEPTRSILFRSAATLSLRAEQTAIAERLICRALSGSPPPAIAVELRALYEEVNFHRHLEVIPNKLVDNRPVPTSFQDVAETESKNLQVSLDSLGDTVALIHDFESVYDALPPITTLPAGDAENDEVMAVAAIIHLMVFCRRQLTMGCLTLMRAQQGDSLLHLRRAIECCAFAVRISKHHELGRVWLNAAVGEEAYRAFRKAFGPRKIFPDAKDPDHDPVLNELYERYDFCSKKAHPNVYGMGGHFEYGDSLKKFAFSLNVFDLPSDHSLISSIYLIFDAHKRMLRLFGRILERYAGDRMKKWWNDFGDVDAKLDIHRERWKAVVPDPRLR